MGSAADVPQASILMPVMLEDTLKSPFPQTSGSKDSGIRWECRLNVFVMGDTWCCWVFNSSRSSVIGAFKSGTRFQIGRIVNFEGHFDAWLACSLRCRWGVFAKEWY